MDFTELGGFGRCQSLGQDFILVNHLPLSKHLILMELIKKKLPIT